MVATTRQSDRQKICDKMLEKALAQPGVRETVEVYLDWKVKDRYLKSYDFGALDKYGLNVYASNNTRSK